MIRYIRPCTINFSITYLNLREHLLFHFAKHRYLIWTNLHPKDTLKLKIPVFDHINHSSLICWCKGFVIILKLFTNGTNKWTIAETFWFCTYSLVGRCPNCAIRQGLLRIRSSPIFFVHHVFHLNSRLVSVLFSSHKIVYSYCTPPKLFFI